MKKLIEIADEWLKTMSFRLFIYFKSNGLHIAWQYYGSVPSVLFLDVSGQIKD